MMTRSEVVALVQDAFDALGEGDLVPAGLRVDETTDLLGPQTLLDSIAFVTFIVEFENRVQARWGDEADIFNLAITEIHDFNPEGARLTVGVLVDYVMREQVSRESPA